MLIDNTFITNVRKLDENSSKSIEITRFFLLKCEILTIFALKTESHRRKILPKRDILISCQKNKKKLAHDFTEKNEYFVILDYLKTPSTESLSKPRISRIIKAL